MLYQIILYLCTNGLQSMNDQKGTLQIGLQPRRLINATSGSFVVLTVQDDGCGIEQSILDRIFAPYFTTKEKGKGTGLGLAIIHSAVEEYGGFIEVESKPGEGTLFSIFFTTTEEPATKNTLSKHEAPIKPYMKTKEL